MIYMIGVNLFHPRMPVFCHSIYSRINTTEPRFRTLLFL